MVATLLVVFVAVLGSASAQDDDYSGFQTNMRKITTVASTNLKAFHSIVTEEFSLIRKIKCFSCKGTAVNSSCADPIDMDNHNLDSIDCEYGVCLKYTKYLGGELYMIRTCSAKLDFHLTLIDGVCRTERNGNGYLCMCGKPNCNSASRPHQKLSVASGLSRLSIVLTIYFLVSSSSFPWLWDFHL